MPRIVKNDATGIATIEQIFAALVNPFSSPAILMYSFLFDLETTIKITLIIENTKKQKECSRIMM